MEPRRVVMKRFIVCYFGIVAFRFVAGIVSLTVVIVGCASIMTGGRSELNVSSYPPGAKIFLNDRSVGKTPTLVPIPGKKAANYKLRIELDGYQPYEIALTRRVSGWVWGNLLLGGLIGLAIDWATGGMYVFEPKHINPMLELAGGSKAHGQDGIYIVLTQEPQPDWQKIGTMIQQ